MAARRYLYRCDAGEIPEIGTGHLRRGLLLARELKRRHGIETAFLVRENAMAEGMVAEGGCRWFPIRGTDDELRATLDTVAAWRPEGVVLDVLDTDPLYVRALKETGVFVVSMDDHGAGAGEAGLVINAFDVEANGATPYTGPSYMVLPPVEAAPREHPGRVRTVLVSFGGYDHLDLTSRALRALEGIGEDVRIVVVMRKMSPNARDVEAYARERRPGRPGVRLYFDVRAMGEVMREADLAVVSGGLTLFEAMQWGLPSVVIAQYGHQLRTAKAVAAWGGAVNLGRGGEGDEARIGECVRGLIADRAGRERLGRRAEAIVDGDGLRDVADLLALVEVRDWDSRFFDRRIARLHPVRLNGEIVRKALRFCREERIECLYWLADFRDPRSIELAEKNGFHLVDFRVRMERELDVGGTEGEDPPGGDVAVRPAVDRDRPALEEIAAESYTDSRFWFDGHFPDELCRKLYRVWVRKSLKGRFGTMDRVFVAEAGGRVVGFVTTDLRPPSTGRIVLVGVHRDVRGRSIGRGLLEHVLGWMRAQGWRRVEVVTQGRNLGAQGLYQRIGFRTVETGLWYHRWFE